LATNIYKPTLDYNRAINLLDYWAREMTMAAKMGRGQLSREIAKEVNVSLSVISDMTRAWYRSAIKLD